MKKSLTALLLVFCGAMLYAQVPSDKSKSAADKKTAAVDTSTAVKKSTKAEAAKAAAAKLAEQEPEESVVMIDSKAEPEDEAGERSTAGAYGSDQEEAPAAGGLPNSYGQCKGVITEGGRTVLVFESPDDGSISFVQVVLGKGKVSWKLLDRITRSGD